jgi:hypothetical protein
MRNKITKNQEHSRTHKERWSRWKRTAVLLGSCLALGSCATAIRTPAGEIPQAGAEPSFLVEDYGPTEREIIVESIRIAQDPESDRESRIDAKVLLVGAALDNKIAGQELANLVLEFIERNASENDLEEIRGGCVYAMAILGERDARIAERSLAVLERALEDDSEDIRHLAVQRLGEIGLSGNGRAHALRIARALGNSLQNANEVLAQDAANAICEIGTGEHIEESDREGIVTILFAAASNPNTVCNVWYCLMDLELVDGISPALLRRIAQESRRTDWSTDGVSCSEWFSE